MFISGILAAGPSYAEKPEHAGKGKGQERHSKSDNGGKSKDSAKDSRGSDRQSHSAGRSDSHFGAHQRVVVRDYYVQAHARGCPPGLAKKNNGCMPPGQARKWNVGRPLPRDVIYYAVSPVLIAQIGAPPSGHKYVRVAADILMIAIGTGMVVDAIQDLGRV